MGNIHAESSFNTKWSGDQGSVGIASGYRLEVIILKHMQILYPVLKQISLYRQHLF